MIYIFIGHTGPISALTVLSNGNLVSGSYDLTVKIWDTSSGNLIQTLFGFSSAVTSMAILTNSSLLTISSVGISMWNPSGDFFYQVNSFNTNGILCSQLFQNGYLAGGSSDTCIYIWDTKSATQLYVLSGHTGAVTCLTVLQNGYLASGSYDLTIRIWSVTSWSIVLVLTEQYPVLSLLSLVNNEFVSGNLGNYISIWNSDTGNLLQTINGNDYSGNYARISNIVSIPTISFAVVDSSRLASSYSSMISIWNINNWNLNKQWTDSYSNSTICCLTSLSDGKLASASGDTIKIWNID